MEGGGRVADGRKYTRNARLMDDNENVQERAKYGSEKTVHADCWSVTPSTRDRTDAFSLMVQSEGTGPQHGTTVARSTSVELNFDHITNLELAKCPHAI